MAKKKRGKNNKNNWSAPKRSLVFKENMQEYVKMTKMLGDRRIMVLLPDKSERMAIIPGRFRPLVLHHDQQYLDDFFVCRRVS